MRDEMKQTMDAMEKCMMSLNSIQASFVSTMNSVKTTGDILRGINNIISGTLPTADAQDVELPAVTLTDKEYFNRVSSIYAKRPNEERLRIILRLLDATHQSYTDYMRKSQKLSERISLSDRTAPERFIAQRQKAKVDESTKIFLNRISKLVDRFFKIRRTMLLELAGRTEILVEKLKDKDGCVPPWFKERIVNKTREETFSGETEALVSKLKSNKRRF